ISVARARDLTLFLRIAYASLASLQPYCPHAERAKPPRLEKLHGGYAYPPHSTQQTRDADQSRLRVAVEWAGGDGPRLGRLQHCARCLGRSRPGARAILGAARRERAAARAIAADATRTPSCGRFCRPLGCPAHDAVDGRDSGCAGGCIARAAGIAA